MLKQKDVQIKSLQLEVKAKNELIAQKDEFIQKNLAYF